MSERINTPFTNEHFSDWCLKLPKQNLRTGLASVSIRPRTACSPVRAMFYKLNLIQSFGSGIRRTKKAMEDNGSPRLEFGPNNDMDDYTQVVAYINPEFARIQEEEARQTQNTDRPGSGAEIGAETGVETGVVIGVENFPDSVKRLLDITIQ